MNWEDNVRKVVPYTPGEQPSYRKMIKLNTNECPYPPSPKVREVLQNFDADRLRLYPDPAASELVEALAARCGLKKEQIFVGVGSDEVLALSFLAFFAGKKPVLFPDITYSFYGVWAGLYGIPYRCPALDEEFHLKKEDYLTENGGIIFPNPNAPTGLAESLETVEGIVAGNPGSVVIVDEAYADFCGCSAMELVNRYENLLVVQTFSKSRSMAGLRIGFAMGSPKLIRALENVKFAYNSYTLNLPSLVLGTEGVKDEAYFQETTGRIVRTREKTAGRLRQLGFQFPDSRANFLFITHEKADAARLYEAVKEARIYVRYFPSGRLAPYLRMTIGTDEEMEQVLAFLEDYLRRN